MSDKTNGGPAFPTEYVKHASGEVGNHVAIMDQSPGMTLRDYFAAKAMQSLIHAGAAVQRHTPEGVLTIPARVGIPPLAYEYADAMLEARSAAND